MQLQGTAMMAVGLAVCIIVSHVSRRATERRMAEAEKRIDKIVSQVIFARGYPPRR